MTKTKTRIFTLAPLALLALGLGACQAIAGIEERKLDPAITGAVGPSKRCKEYCTTVLANCQGKNAVYNGQETCLGVCALLDEGDFDEPGGDNTLACRHQQAGFAEREPDDHCKNAGPGGNGVCGTDCEAYCDLFPQVCKEQYQYGDRANCIKACGAVLDQDSFDVTRDHGGDSIECRLVHTASSTTKPDEHCAHAPIPPTQPWCAGAPDAAPTCDDYCRATLAACDEGLTQYESLEQCQAVCKELDLGKNKDTMGNTVACRRYHSFSATLAPTTHCYHSGPTGDGHCGGATGNCDSYCKLVAAACSDDFKTQLGDEATCLKTCNDLPEAKLDSKYTIATAKKSKGLSCRVLNAARAFEDPKACAAALGGGACEP